MTGRSRISDEQWQRIYRRVLAGEQTSALDRELGYSKGSVTKVLKRRFDWTPRPQRAPLTRQQTDVIHQRLQEGEAIGAIARDLGVHRENLYSLMKRRYGYEPDQIRYRALWRPTIKLDGKTDTDLAYVAGIIDGEGSIMKSNRNRKNPVWNIKVNMTDRPVIEWLLTFGGGFYVRPSPDPGRIKEQYEWKMSRQIDVQTMLFALLPYLRVKRAQADAALAEFEEQGAPMRCDWEPGRPTSARRRGVAPVDPPDAAT